MSKDKYPSIFSESNGGYCVHYPSNIFRNMRNFENWGTFRDIARLFGHVMGLVQSLRAKIFDRL